MNNSRIYLFGRDNRQHLPFTIYANQSVDQIFEGRQPISSVVFWEDEYTGGDFAFPDWQEQICLAKLGQWKQAVKKNTDIVTFQDDLAY